MKRVLTAVLMLMFCGGCQGVHWPWQAWLRLDPAKTEAVAEKTTATAPVKKSGKRYRIVIRPMAVTTRPAEVPNE